VGGGEGVGQGIAAAAEPIVSVVAQAGYGKTTLLGAWAGREPDRVAWLSLDRHDNDLGLLVTYATAALNRVRSIDQRLLRPNPHGHTVASAATRVVSAMTEPRAPVALVLDNVEVLENP